MFDLYERTNKNSQTAKFTWIDLALNPSKSILILRIASWKVLQPRCPKQLERKALENLEASRGFGQERYLHISTKHLTNVYKCAIRCRQSEKQCLDVESHIHLNHSERRYAGIQWNPVTHCSLGRMSLQRNSPDCDWASAVRAEATMTWREHAPTCSAP